jgi:ABC-type antimicrobial peptide transport system permease subunit
MKQIAESLVMTLPDPRYSYYESSDFDVIQKSVTQYTNKMVEDLGFYPITANLDILEDMENYSAAVLFMGLIFDIIILLFIIIAVLLIHSLLMISVETKTFEIGVMRMIGLSKSGIMMMVIIQAFMFVLPSLIIGITLSFPALYVIFTFLFEQNLGLKFEPVPSGSAFL